MNGKQHRPFTTISCHWPDAKREFIPQLGSGEASVGQVQVSVSVSCSVHSSFEETEKAEVTATSSWLWGMAPAMLYKEAPGKSCPS